MEEARNDREGVNDSIEELNSKIKTLSTNVLYKPDSKKS